MKYDQKNGGESNKNNNLFFLLVFYLMCVLLLCVCGNLRTCDSVNSIHSTEKKKKNMAESVPILFEP